MNDNDNDYVVQVAQAYKAREEAADAANAERARVAGLIAKDGADLMDRVRKHLLELVGGFNQESGRTGITIADQGTILVSLKGSVPKSFQVQTVSPKIEWAAPDAYGSSRMYSYALTAKLDGPLGFASGSDNPDFTEWHTPEEVASEIFNSATAGIATPP